LAFDELTTMLNALSNKKKPTFVFIQ
jgi:hypothetical protein